ncbi:Segregation and condensation protein A [gamma proteobacterium IMCC1989]|nr:Segregation and condensation protein A [gamma proteobacterium IMCC1989]
MTTTANDNDLIADNAPIEKAVKVEETNNTAAPDSVDALSSSSTDKPEQDEMPFALVNGEAYTNLPKDLYIPPDALEVILEAFEGPLDLLLYLIRRQNLDILEVNVSQITHQYVAYVDMMNNLQFELAAEYLVMAAMLAEIKSRMLLPRNQEEDEDEGDDPRAALIRRLQEYERFKTAAEDIEIMPRMYRDIHPVSVDAPDRNLTRPDPEVDFKEILLALSDVLRRADMFESHQVEMERMSTRERMTQVLERLSAEKTFVPFVSLFTVSEGRLGVIVTFMAIMELIKESLVDIVQNESFGAIHVKAKSE